MSHIINMDHKGIYFSHGSTALVGLRLFYEASLSHSLRHTALGTTPPNE
jgi:hypothetical protein